MTEVFDDTFDSIPKGGKGNAERPKAGPQPAVIAQYVNEGKKLTDGKYGKVEEYISCFFVIQLKQESSNPEFAGQRLLTRLYFSLKDYDAAAKGGKGRDSKLVEISKELWGLDYRQVWRAKGSLAAAFEGVPVLANIKHKENGGWKTTISELPEGMEVLTVSPDYKRWEVRAEDSQNGDDDIPF